MSSPYVLSNYDGLFAGATDVVATQGETILPSSTGAYGVLDRGTVLGQVLYLLGTPAAAAGNSGNATLSDVALGHGRLLGDYTLVCSAVAVAAGEGTAAVPSHWQLFDPNNQYVNTLAAGVDFAGPIHLKVSEGNRASAIGDTFTIPVELNPVDQYVPAKTAAVDGSENANAILLNKVDCTAAPASGILAVQGEFVGSKLIFVGDNSLADHRLMLRSNGLIVSKKAIRAAVPL